MKEKIETMRIRKVYLKVEDGKEEEFQMTNQKG